MENILISSTGRVRFAGRAAVALLLAVILIALPPRANADDAESFSRETVLDGSADLVWRLLTTKQGIQSWLAPQADVDWRVGGSIKTHHDATGTLGDAQTTVSRILSLAPGRSFSVRVERTPEDYPFASMVEGTWYDVGVESMANGKTRLRCVGHGLGEGMAQLATRPLFQQGADLAFGKLKQSLGVAKARAEKAEAARAQAAKVAATKAAAAKGAKATPRKTGSKTAAPKPTASKG